MEDGISVYEYNDKFIEWLKKDNLENHTLNNSSAKDEYSKLKNVCKKLLNTNHVNYGSGGYVDAWLCHNKKKKLKKVDKNWNVK